MAKTFLIQICNQTNPGVYENTTMDFVSAYETVDAVSSADGVFFYHPLTHKPSVVVNRSGYSDWDVNMSGITITAKSAYEAVHFAEFSMADPAFATNYVASLNPSYLN